MLSKIKAFVSDVAGECLTGSFWSGLAKQTFKYALQAAVDGGLRAIGAAFKRMADRLRGTVDVEDEYVRRPQPPVENRFGRTSAVTMAPRPAAPVHRFDEDDWRGRAHDNVFGVAAGLGLYTDGSNLKPFRGWEDLPEDNGFTVEPEEAGSEDDLEASYARAMSSNRS